MGKPWAAQGSSTVWRRAVERLERESVILGGTDDLGWLTINLGNTSWLCHPQPPRQRRLHTVGLLSSASHLLLWFLLTCGYILTIY